MELIQTVTVGAGGAANIEFTSIPATFDDLVVKLSLRGTDAGTGGGILRFNTGGTYTTRRLLGDGSSRFSDTGADNFLVNSSGLTANTFANAEVYIPNYRVSAAKSFSTDSVQENNATSALQMIAANLWSETAAITSMTIDMFAGNFVEGSSASLYGIRKFNTTTQPKATGGAISYDAVNNKWVHVFTASGTFTPSQDLTGVEYLVVAGGGSGGCGAGGGGGAGGYRSSVAGQASGGGGSAESALSLTSGTNYTVTIGAGGASRSGGDANGFSGSNSVFSTITATGGGAGAGFAGPGITGGSGGGASYSTTGGSGTTNQGFAGGSNLTNGAGGGGAGEAGNTDASGYGGDGVASNITGVSVIRAGGGGGVGGVYPALGGDGGGGNATLISGSSVLGGNGTANTGSGGGGSNGNLSTGAGGSGIVIVRYS